MEKWVVTGISGSGRIEFLEELKEYAESQGRKVEVHDVGHLISEECDNLGIELKDDKILDVDRNLLSSLRSNALKEVENRILKSTEVDLHLIGIHALFRWKHRIIPGISFSDILTIEPDGFMNVVHNVEEIITANKENPKWDEETLPGGDETQAWLMEEEFVTQVLANVTKNPMYLVARNQDKANIYDLFFTEKEKIYLSYPITAVKENSPELLDKIQGEIFEQLKEEFIVFNPLDIEDMSLIEDEEGIPPEIENLTPEAKQKIKTRTIERDYRFIDQADYVVVFYLTEKTSPGVLSEIFYAKRNQKPVYMVFPYSKSPFLEDAITHIDESPEELMNTLKRL